MGVGSEPGLESSSLSISSSLLPSVRGRGCPWWRRRNLGIIVVTEVAMKWWTVELTGKLRRVLPGVNSLTRCVQEGLDWVAGHPWVGWWGSHFLRNYVFILRIRFSKKWRYFWRKSLQSPSCRNGNGRLAKTQIYHVSSCWIQQWQQQWHNNDNHSKLNVWINTSFLYQ